MANCFSSTSLPDPLCLILHCRRHKAPEMKSSEAYAQPGRSGPHDVVAPFICLACLIGKKVSNGVVRASKRNDLCSRTWGELTRNSSSNWLLISLWFSVPFAIPEGWWQQSSVTWDTLMASIFSKYTSDLGRSTHASLEGVQFSENTKQPSSASWAATIQFKTSRHWDNFYQSQRLPTRWDNIQVFHRPAIAEPGQHSTWVESGRMQKSDPLISEVSLLPGQTMEMRSTYFICSLAYAHWTADGPAASLPHTKNQKCSVGIHMQSSPIQILWWMGGRTLVFTALWSLQESLFSIFRGPT